jgi:type VII secretion integral membrane protein EccD
MAESGSRITIVGPDRRADVVLPANVPLADLVPDVAEILGVAIGPDQAVLEPRLYTMLGPALNPDQTLAEQGIKDGALLLLRDAAEPPPPPVMEDLVETVATVLDDRSGRWTGESARQLAAFTAGAWVVGSAVFLLVERDPSQRGLLAGLMIVPVMAAAAAMRMLRQPLAGIILILASLPAYAVASESVAVLFLGADGPAALIIGVAVGATAGGLVGLAVMPATPVPLLAITVLAAPLAVVVVAGRWLGADPVREAAVVAILWLVIADWSPRAALRLSGLGELFHESASAVVAERVGVGHRVLAAMLGAAAVGLSGAMLVLALSGDGAAQLLCATLALALALRMHRFQLKIEVYPLALATVVGVLALEGALALRLSGLPSAGPPAALTLMLVSAGVPLVVAVVPPRQRASSPSWRRRLRLAETVVDLSLLPLLALVLGLFSSLLQTGARLG